MPNDAARSAVSSAVAKGLLPHPTVCEVCKATSADGVSIVYHHHSYAKEDWLNVTPVCRSCHALIHSRKIKEPRTGEFREALDLHDGVEDNDVSVTIRLRKSQLRWASELAGRANASEVAALFGKISRADLLRWAVRIGLDELERNNLSALRLAREREQNEENE